MPQTDDNEERPDNSFRRRLSFDLIGGSGLLLGGKGKPQQYQSQQETSRKSPNIISPHDSYSSCSLKHSTSSSPESHAEDNANRINDAQFEDQEDNLDSTCSSPEQETVRPKKSSLTCTRGPPVQQLFARGTEVTSMPISESITTPIIDESQSILSVEISDTDPEDHKIIIDDAKTKES